MTNNCKVVALTHMFSSTECCGKRNVKFRLEELLVSVTDPKILKKGGGGRQFISPVVIYRKCTQRKKAAF